MSSNDILYIIGVLIVLFFIGIFCFSLVNSQIGNNEDYNLSKICYQNGGTDYINNNNICITETLDLEGLK